MNSFSFSMSEKVFTLYVPPPARKTEAHIAFTRQTVYLTRYIKTSCDETSHLKKNGTLFSFGLIDPVVVFQATWSRIPTRVNVNLQPPNL